MQFSSSDPSLQSLFVSHLLSSDIHLPDLQVNSVPNSHFDRVNIRSSGSNSPHRLLYQVQGFLPIGGFLVNVQSPDASLRDPDNPSGQTNSGSASAVITC